MSQQQGTVSVVGNRYRVCVPGHGVIWVAPPSGKRACAAGAIPAARFAARQCLAKGGVGIRPVKNPVAVEAYHGKGTPVFVKPVRPVGTRNNPPSYPFADPHSPVGFQMGTLPPAAFYVTATDSFMSGWGPVENMRNVVVFCASSRADAEVAAQNLRDRPEMKRVSISSAPPRPTAKTLYSVLSGGRWLDKGRPFREAKGRRRNPTLVARRGYLHRQGSSGGPVGIDVSSTPERAAETLRHVRSTLPKKNPGDFVVWRLASRHGPAAPVAFASSQAEGQRLLAEAREQAVAAGYGRELKFNLAPPPKVRGTGDETAHFRASNPRNPLTPAEAGYLARAGRERVKHGIKARDSYALGEASGIGFATYSSSPLDSQGFSDGLSLVEDASVAAQRLKARKNPEPSGQWQWQKPSWLKHDYKHYHDSAGPDRSCKSCGRPQGWVFPEEKPWEPLPRNVYGGTSPKPKPWQKGGASDPTLLPQFGVPSTGIPSGGCKRCKGACKVKLGKNLVPCPMCQRKAK